MAQFIIRVDSKKNLERSYLANEIVFSCPVNWYDFAVKHQNITIGDQLECVYAHIPLSDPRISEVDQQGRPMGNNLTILVDHRNNTAFLRHEPVLLTPTFCFFQDMISIQDFKAQKKLNRFFKYCSFTVGNTKRPAFSFDLNAYATRMGYKIDEALFWVVRDPGLFEADLRNNIPDSIHKNQGILISDGTGGYVSAFSDANPINFMPVDYDRHYSNEIFYEKNSYRAEMWWKDSRYRDQQEGRIIIPGVHFKQRYDDGTKYDWEKNRLKVKLPNMKSFSFVCDGSKEPYIYFGLNDDNSIQIWGARMNFHI